MNSRKVIKSITSRTILHELNSRFEVLEQMLEYLHLEHQKVLMALNDKATLEDITEYLNRFETLNHQGQQ